MSRLIKSLDLLLKSSEALKHGRGLYIDHCFEIYNNLKSSFKKDDIVLAGLLHSIYGNEFYDPNFKIDRKIVKDCVGEYAEQLIYAFNTLEDRDYQILRNKDKDDFFRDLFDIAQANIASQKEGNNDPEIAKLNYLFGENSMRLANNPKSFTVEKIVIDNKEVIVFDSLLENHYIEALNDYCTGSSFKPNHGSSKFSYERDERFACYINKEEFHNIRLDETVKKIANFIKKDLWAGSYYINHYGHMAQAGRHCDSSIEDTYTILIFPNKFWEETWGGGFKIINESSKFNFVVDFVPGRVIFFDSKLDHEVLPLTINAKRSRYSIAIKCAGESAVEYLENSFGRNNIIEIKHDL